jgi:hypothetical protein
VTALLPPEPAGVGELAARVETLAVRVVEAERAVAEAKRLAERLAAIEAAVVAAQVEGARCRRRYEDLCVTLIKRLNAHEREAGGEA